MSVKKRATYEDMSKQLAALQQKMETERKRISSVMVDALLDGDTITKLGSYSDTDLRRIAGMLAQQVGTCVERLEAERAAKKAKVEADKQPPVEPVQQVQQSAQGPYTGSPYNNG